jgi:hypothetical protein
MKNSVTGKRRPQIYYGVGPCGHLFLASPPNAVALGRSSSRVLRVGKAQSWSEVASALGGPRELEVEFGDLLDGLWELEGRLESRCDGQYPSQGPDLNEWIREQGRFSNWEVHDDLPPEFLGAAHIDIRPGGEVKVHWSVDSLPHLEKIATVVGWELVEANEFFSDAS